MRSNSIKIIRVSITYLLIASLLIFFFGNISMAQNLEYNISIRPDGGYKLLINYSKRVWQPITAEGFFPKIERSYTIELISKGKDWSFRNQKGFYYPLEKIQSADKAWDIGYAWVDANRKYIYLNLFWVKSPDGLTPSDVNGKYVIGVN
jgi:hypothetical protein